MLINTLAWIGTLFMVLSVILSSRGFGEIGVRRRNDDAEIQAYMERKRKRIQWAIRSFGVAVVFYILVFIIYAVG
ncbi:hypothetical protein PO903_10060 [Paenibacillus sp. PK4536]|uniref:Uncharacterized protein n=1 Tax=Paenibacillus nuruki TaxID=1886670 RepID=A0A1E3L615_9BACL|nr:MULTISPECIES: hypothetical protein [Paenibacillus]ODP29272.1 hypothetical protein PTI45_01281 [Paenibacillus nuruki]TKJ93487.1 hypothetical protein PaeCFBP13512_03620 [Paenibacillus sp. CFBP13512]WIM41189.1 hypothetical protein PO903_10060 [Paenibacillus sp. PK4536]CAJ1316463.1 Twin transmembrane helix small protein [Paenibacillus nuruki]